MRKHNRSNLGANDCTVQIACCKNFMVTFDFFNFWHFYTFVLSVSLQVCYKRVNWPLTAFQPAFFLWPTCILTPESYKLLLSGSLIELSDSQAGTCHQIWCALISYRSTNITCQSYCKQLLIVVSISTHTCFNTDHIYFPRKYIK